LAKRVKNRPTVDERDYEKIAQQVRNLNEEVAALAERLTEAEQVNSRLEAAAQNTARALKEISRHWDSVYEAMRRGTR
jgi:outer membrane murein-binding lipoprotein Lpp